MGKSETKLDLEEFTKVVQVEFTASGAAGVISEAEVRNILEQAINKIPGSKLKGVTSFRLMVILG